MCKFISYLSTWGISPEHTKPIWRKHSLGKFRKPAPGENPEWNRGRCCVQGALPNLLSVLMATHCHRAGCSLPTHLANFPRTHCKAFHPLCAACGWKWISALRLRFLLIWTTKSCSLEPGGDLASGALVPSGMFADLILWLQPPLFLTMLLLLQGFWSNDSDVMSVSTGAFLNTCKHAGLSVSLWDMDEMISRGPCLPHHLCVIWGVEFYIGSDNPAPSTFKSLLEPLHAFALH